MKCAFHPCGEVDHLPVKLTHQLLRGEREDYFCGHAHLLAYLLQMAGESAQLAVTQALLAAQTPEGRKALVAYLVDKVL